METETTATTETMESTAPTETEMTPLNKTISNGRK